MYLCAFSTAKISWIRWRTVLVIVEAYRNHVLLTCAMTTQIWIFHSASLVFSIRYTAVNRTSNNMNESCVIRIYTHTLYFISSTLYILFIIIHILYSTILYLSYIIILFMLLFYSAFLNFKQLPMLKLMLWYCINILRLLSLHKLNKLYVLI